MTICINDGGHCMCQPDEGVPCPIKPQGWRKVRAMVLAIINRFKHKENQ